MRLTLPIGEVLPATPRARIVRLDLHGAFFRYLPGQGVLVAAHGSDLPRPYSLATAPGDAERDGYLELLVGLEADGLAGPHLTLTPGSLVDVEGPIGRLTLPPDPAEHTLVFIAGGTGIAPLRAMLRHALGTRHRQIGLVYSARTPTDFAYVDEWQRLAAEGRIEFRQTVTRDAETSESAGWTGRRGRLDREALAGLTGGPATLYFVCGPPPLVGEVLTSLGDLGVERRLICVEEWG